MKNETLDKLSDLTNRSYGQTLFLFKLLDNNFKKLVLLEQKLKNNFLNYCPDDIEECEKVLALGDESGWVFSDERYSYLDDFLNKKDKIGKECIHKETGCKGIIKYELSYTPDSLKNNKTLFFASWGIYWYNDPIKIKQHGLLYFWQDKNKIDFNR
jgi:hypothetical protein